MNLPNYLFVLTINILNSQVLSCSFCSQNGKREERGGAALKLKVSLRSLDFLFLLLFLVLSGIDTYTKFALILSLTYLSDRNCFDRRPHVKLNSFSGGD